eukprot:1418665-Amphidinium_carterae.1
MQQFLDWADERERAADQELVLLYFEHLKESSPSATRAQSFKECLAFPCASDGHCSSGGIEEAVPQTPLTVVQVRFSDPKRLLSLASDYGERGEGVLLGHSLTSKTSGAAAVAGRLLPGAIERLNG